MAIASPRSLGAIIIGTAGWSIPRAVADEFPGTGSHLQRYSRVLIGAEINSSFHRPHAHRVYERWAAATPPDFRFSVKLPRRITHEGELRRARSALMTFFEQVSGLGEKLGPLLVQLPPSLVFNPRVSRPFFATVREFHRGHIVCEPRHPSWFEAPAEDLFVIHRVARVATHPSRIRAALSPGGWVGEPGVAERPVTYYRLHGSPRKYWSLYPPDRIRQWAAELQAHACRGDAWCIFDNTASGAATRNALEMLQYVSGRQHETVGAHVPAP